MSDHPTFDDPPKTYRELLIVQQTERELFAMSSPLRVAEFEHEQTYIALQRIEEEYKEVRNARRREWDAAVEKLKAVTTDDPDQAKQHLANADAILAELDTDPPDDTDQAEQE